MVVKLLHLFCNQSIYRIEAVMWGVVLKLVGKNYFSSKQREINK
jgi:hypothetical protein